MRKLPTPKPKGLKKPPPPPAPPKKGKAFGDSPLIEWLNNQEYVLRKGE